MSQAASAPFCAWGLAQYGGLALQEAPPAAGDHCLAAIPSVAQRPYFQHVAPIDASALQFPRGLADHRGLTTVGNRRNALMRETGYGLAVCTTRELRNATAR